MAKEFSPRANRCSRCPQLQATNPPRPNEKQCAVFDWLIRNVAAKRQAMCKESGPSKFMAEEA